MEDDWLYFCIIPLLKRHVAQVKFLVQEEGGGTNEKMKELIIRRIVVISEIAAEE